jgi:hydroxymethylbilane synthase
VSGRTIVVGTRGSRLALRQTELVVQALQTNQPNVRFQVKTVHTTGDRSPASLSRIGGIGVFVVEIERALLKGDVDVAIHSLKDLPSAETEGLVIGAVPLRDDFRDVLVSRNGDGLGDLPPEAVIGTGSPRRAAQILAFRADLRVQDIRGNVDTRLRKVEAREIDAVALAAAGLARLGLLDRVSQFLSADEMLPAVGQGALAVQVRADDPEPARILASIDHAATRSATVAERAFQRRLGGGCQAAMAALGEVRNGSLSLRGLVADPSGDRLLRGQTEGPTEDAEALGSRLAEQLIDQGADALLEAAS